MLIADCLQTLLFALGSLFQFCFLHLILSRHLRYLTFHSRLLSCVLFFCDVHLQQLFPDFGYILRLGMPSTQLLHGIVSSVLFLLQQFQPLVRLMPPIIERVHQQPQSFRAFIFQSLALFPLGFLLPIERFFLRVFKRHTGILQFSSGYVVFLLYRCMGL